MGLAFKYAGPSDSMYMFLVTEKGHVLTRVSPSSTTTRVAIRTRSNTEIDKLASFCTGPNHHKLELDIPCQLFPQDEDSIRKLVWHTAKIVTYLGSLEGGALRSHVSEIFINSLNRIDDLSETPRNSSTNFISRLFGSAPSANAIWPLARAEREVSEVDVMKFLKAWLERSMGSGCEVDLPCSAIYSMALGLATGLDYGMPSGKIKLDRKLGYREHVAGHTLVVLDEKVIYLCAHELPDNLKNWNELIPHNNLEHYIVGMQTDVVVCEILEKWKEGLGAEYIGVRKDGLEQFLNPISALELAKNELPNEINFNQVTRIMKDKIKNRLDYSSILRYLIHGVHCLGYEFTGKAASYVTSIYGDISVSSVGAAPS